MEFEHSMPISQMGMLRPGEAPSKAGVGPGLEPGALGCSCCLRLGLGVGEDAQSYPTLSDPMDCSLPGSSVHGDSPGKNTGVGCHASTRRSSQSRN